MNQFDVNINKIIKETVHKIISEKDKDKEEEPGEERKEKKTKPEKTIVKFEGNTDHPFNVTFSERGFLIGNTRMSFEDIEEAISKEYNIVLNRGEGLELTQSRMNEILKYKDLY